MPAPSLNVSYVNVVTDYGADHTGATDASPQIQDALDAFVAKADLRPIYLPAGTYRLDSTLECFTTDPYQPALKLFGDGRNGTVLQSRIGGGPVIDLKGVVGIPATTYNFQVDGYIRDLTIDGARSGAACDGIRAIAVWNLLVERVQITAMSRHGLYFPFRPDINQNPDYYAPTGIVLRHLNLTYCAGYGIYGACGNSLLLKVHDTGVVLNAAGGIRSSGSQTVIEDCGIALNGFVAWAWRPARPYAAGALARNDGGRFYICTVAGTSGTAPGPTGTGTGQGDGSCTWNFVADARIPYPPYGGGITIERVTASSQGPLITRNELDSNFNYNVWMEAAVSGTILQNRHNSWHGPPADNFASADLDLHPSVHLRLGGGGPVTGSLSSAPNLRVHNNSHRAEGAAYSATAYSLTNSATVGRADVQNPFWNSGFGDTPNLLRRFARGGGAHCRPVVAGGAITGVAVMYGGMGYDVAPEVLFPGGAPEAVANAYVTQGIVFTKPTAVGTGYVAPTISVSGGRAAAVNPWAASTAYAAQTTVSTASGARYTCVKAGTSGATEPAGSTFMALPILDDQCVWVSADPVLALRVEGGGVVRIDVIYGGAGFNGPTAPALAIADASGTEAAWVCDAGWQLAAVVPSAGGSGYSAASARVVARSVPFSSQNAINFRSQLVDEGSLVQSGNLQPIALLRMTDGATVAQRMLATSAITSSGAILPFDNPPLQLFGIQNPSANVFKVPYYGNYAFAGSIMLCAPPPGTLVSLAVVVNGGEVRTTASRAQGPEPWQTNRAYAVGAIVQNTGVIYRCAVGGTSAGGPTGQAPGIADGSVTWDWMAPAAWAPATPYSVGDIRVNNAGTFYRCTAAGTSAGTGPSGTGGSIADGSATWQNVAGAYESFSIGGAYFLTADLNFSLHGRTDYAGGIPLRYGPGAAGAANFVVTGIL